MLLMAVGYSMLLLPTTSPAVLACASVLVGGGYGAHAALGPVIASERFGLRHLALIYMAINLGLGVGSYAYGNLLAASVTAAASRRYGLALGGLCTHLDCFTPAYATCACTALLAAFLCLVLAHRSRRRAA